MRDDGVGNSVEAGSREDSHARSHLAENLVIGEAQRLLHVNGLLEAHKAKALTLVPDHDDRGAEDLARKPLKVGV